jgi:septal ring factor EnvC (AmiA/AmiB activator)
MSIPTFHHKEADLKRAWGALPAVLLSVVAALAAVAAVAVFFWPNDIDPEVRATLRYVGAGQQQTTSAIKAINDSLAAERKAINDSLAAERRDLKMLSDQFLALAARQSTLQDDATRILRNNAELAERLKATQTQMAQDNASVAEQLKALTQMARDNTSAVEQLKERHEQMAGLLAKVSEESLRPHTPLPPPHPRPAMPKRKPAAPSQARIQPQSPFELQRREQ